MNGFLGLKTYSTKHGNVLDISEREYNSPKDLMDAVYKVCEKYHTWNPSGRPDLLLMNDEQRSMFPPETYIMEMPWNIMEMVSPSTDNTKLDGIDIPKPEDNNGLLSA